MHTLKDRYLHFGKRMQPHRNFSDLSVLQAFIALLLLAPPQIDAATYYVSRQGNDNNSGLSWDASWGTAQRAGDTAIAGDTVIIKNSTKPYRAFFVRHSGTKTNPITFRGENLENPPVFTGSIRGKGWKRSHMPEVWFIDTSAKPIYFVEDGTPLQHASNEKCVDGRWHWSNGRLFYRPTGDSPSDHDTWRTVDSGGILINKQSWIVIQDIAFKTAGGAAVNITSGSNNLIRNIKVKWYWRGLNVQGSGHGNTLEESEIRECREGVYLWRGASNNLIKNNHIIFNGNEPLWPFKEGNDRSGIDIGHAGPPSTGNMIVENEVAYNGGPNSDAGIIAFNAPNTRIERNHVHHNFGPGINVTIKSDGSLVADNIVEFNGIEAVSRGYKGIYGLSVRRSSNVSILRNQILGNHASPDSRWPGKGLGPKGGLDLQGIHTDVMSNIRILDNEVHGTEGGPDIYISGTPKLPGLLIKDNAAGNMNAE